MTSEPRTPEIIPYETPNPRVKKDDFYYLKVISICHYVWGAPVAVIGLVAWWTDAADPATRWLPFVLLAYGVLTAASGYFMRIRQFRVLSLIIAALTCIWIPLGTILGISTIVILHRPNIQAGYGETGL